MPDEADYMNSVEFVHAVLALRGIPPVWRSLAHHAAQFWSNDELIERALNIPIDDEIRGVLQ